MTTDERLDRIEHVTAALVEERRKDREEYRQIFEGVARGSGLELLDEVFDFVVDRLTVSGKFGLAYYQPKFICTQVVEACKCFGLRPQLTEELVTEALSNLYFEIADVQDAEQTA